MLGQDLALTMAAAARFRNVLVHDYAEVDDAKVVAHLVHLPEIRTFVAALTALLDDGSSA